MIRYGRVICHFFLTDENDRLTLITVMSSIISRTPDTVQIVRIVLVQHTVVLIGVYRVC